MRTATRGSVGTFHLPRKSGFRTDVTYDFTAAPAHNNKLRHKLRVKKQKEHAYRYSLHNTVGTTFLMAHEQSEWPNKRRNAPFSDCWSRRPPYWIRSSDLSTFLRIFDLKFQLKSAFLVPLKVTNSERIEVPRHIGTHLCSALSLRAGKRREMRNSASVGRVRHYRPWT